MYFFHLRDHYFKQFSDKFFLFVFAMSRCLYDKYPKIVLPLNFAISPRDNQTNKNRFSFLKRENSFLKEIKKSPRLIKFPAVKGTMMIANLFHYTILHLCK